MMLRHADAIGYLTDLAKEVGEPWFNMICDLATIGGVNNLVKQDIDTLASIYVDRASYVGIKGAPIVGVPTVIQNDFLTELSASAFQGNTLRAQINVR